MKKIYYILIAIITVGLIAGIYGLTQLYKSHPDYKEMEPEHTLKARVLFDAYRNNKTKADSTYTGKMIALKGTPDKIEQVDSLTIAVYIFEEGMFGEEGIRCTMLPGYNEKANDLRKNPDIYLKGFCAGYNDTDVILEKCSIINN